MVNIIGEKYFQFYTFSTFIGSEHSSIINSIIKSSFKRDPDLHNHALDALMRGESFNDSTNHQKKFKSGDGGMVAVGDLKGLLLLFPSALTQLVLLQLNMSEKNFPLHVKCKY